MKSSKIKVSFLAAVLLASVASFPLSTSVFADTMPQTNQSKVERNNNEYGDVKLSQQTINQFDQYVTVVNNRFVLNQTAIYNFSASEVSVVKKMLNTSNQEVKENNEIIDPNTKEIINQSADPFIVMAAYNKNYTTKAFWWGKRYFRHIASLRNDQSLFLSALGDSIAYASPYATLAANVASMGVGYVAGQYNGAPLHWSDITIDIDIIKYI